MTVREAWAGFSELIGLTNAGEIQKREMQKAFYAGAFFMLTEFSAIGDDEVSEREGVKRLEALRNEIVAFSKMQARQG